MDDAPWISKEASGAPEPSVSPPPPQLQDAPFAVTPKQEEMPGILDAAMHGLGSAWSGLKQTATLGSTAPPTTHEASPAAAPFDLSDLTSPISRGAPKMAYRIAEGAPTLAAGIAGGIGGGAVGAAPGAIIGGAAGAALGSVAQSIGPVFAEELKRTPQDPDGAWDRSVKIGAANGLFSAAGWAAFPLRLAGGPLKQMMFQAFGVQPAISVANQATTNVIRDDPITKDLGQSLIEGTVMSAVPAVGHAVVKATLPKSALPPSPRMADPDMKAVGDRIVDTNNGKRYVDFDQIYTDSKDDLHPMRVAEKVLTDGNMLPVGESPYYLARLTRGNSGRSSAWIDYETFDFNSGQRSGDSLRKILAPVKDEVDALNAYLLAKRAVDLDARGIDSGVPAAEAARVVSNPNMRGAFEPVAQRIYGYQDRLLDYLKDSGVLNQDQVDAMRQANRDYVPFYRFMEDDTKPSTPGGSNVKTFNPLKKIEGSERQVINPIESIIKNTHFIIDMAEKNRAMQAFGELVARSPRGSDIATPAQAQMRPIQLSQREMQNVFNAANVPNMYGPPTNFTVFRPDAFRPGHNQVAYYKDGKRHVLDTDPMLAKAVNGMNERSIKLLEKIAATPAKMLRAGVTLEPTFFIRNMARDQLMAFSLSNNGYIPMYDFLKGMRSVMGGKFDSWLESRGGSNAATNAISAILGKGDDYRQWLRSGGANAALISGDRNYIASEMQRLASSNYSGMKHVITNPLNALQAMSELFESATRVGEFGRARKGGKSLHEAGFDSREITLDFWRIGARARSLNNIIPFLNAKIEGLDRLGRGAWENPYRTGLKLFAGITLPSLYLAWSNFGDKRLEEIPSWEKDIFWHYPTDDWKPMAPDQLHKIPEEAQKTGNYQGLYRRASNGQWFQNHGNIYKIPKPFEPGIIAGSLPERMIEAYWKENPDAWRNFGKTLQRSLLLEPGDYIPAFAKPGIEHITGKSFFTERPLEPKAFTDYGGILPKERFTPYTTETSKIVGAGLGKLTDASISSPIILENYIRNYTGSLGMQAMRMADHVLTKSGIVKTPPKPEDTAADKFFIRGFVSRYPSSGAESIQKFYETFNERQMAYNTARALDKRGDSAAAQNIRERYATERGQAIYKNISNQQKYIRNVYLDQNMSPEEKRRVIDDTYLSMIEQAREGIKLFRSTKK